MLDRTLSISARVLSGILKSGAFDDSLGLIEAKDERSNFAFLGQGLNHRSVNTEVILPAMNAGMEKPNRVSCSGMERRHVRAFVPVAKYAAIRKIIELRETTVFPADDVINLVGETGPIFRIEAVLTTKLGPKSYNLAERLNQLRRQALKVVLSAPSPCEEYVPVQRNDLFPLAPPGRVDFLFP